MGPVPREVVEEADYAMLNFSGELRRRRREAGLSLGELAERTHYDRCHLHHVESGRRAATGPLAEAVDGALCANGELLEAWQRDHRLRREAAASRQTRAAALAASQDLGALVEIDIAELHAGAVETAIDYLAARPGPMMNRAHALRDEALGRVRSGRHRPSELTDLYRTVGRLSGILAYALLDMGNPREAMQHAVAAGRCAAFAGDTGLAAWVAGTQSLIARFQGDFDLALHYARGGLRRAGSRQGTGEARLRCGEAQCLANLGDSRGANRALNAAEDARDRMREPDSDAGLFGFSRAKQCYYAGSSLIWLGGGRDAHRAVRETVAAIGIWRVAPVAERSLDDERLAQVYLATARAQLGEVEGAAEAVRPVLSLPAEDRISWIVKRVDRLAGMLSAPRYDGNRTAAETVEAIRALGAHG
ncbi:helix-turn-helix domain-containing protein [Streptomyces sp. NPDC020965]|uniref:helix-turn-helix domain-containing protein n=1 Tax=Streptomyces sp. NPDC020965 TaxID=3365105 RepID=UPI0037880CC7